MSYLVLYVPITLVILSVLEACKQDDRRAIVRSTAVNFAALTGVLILGSILVFLINKYL